MSSKPSSIRSGAQARWLTNEEQRSWRAMLRGSRLLERALDKALREHDVALSEYEIISMVSESSSTRLRMSDLADMVVQSRSRLTHTAKRLEERGWVVREPCVDDKRGVVLVLTPEGKRMIKTLARVHVASVHEHFLDPLTTEQFTALGEAMGLVRDHLDPDGLSGR